MDTPDAVVEPFLQKAIRINRIAAILLDDLEEPVKRRLGLADLLQRLRGLRRDIGGSRFAFGKFRTITRLHHGQRYSTTRHDDNPRLITPHFTARNALVDSLALPVTEFSLLIAAAPAPGTAFASGAAIGFGAAVPPGPVNLEIIRRTTRGGFLAGASVGLGAVTVDVIFAVLTVLGTLSVLNALPLVRYPITVVGIGLLIYLGIGSLASFRQHLRSRRFLAEPSEPVASDPAGVLKPTARAGYLTGLLLCSTSPYQALFWLTVVPTVATGGATRMPDVSSATALCFGVFLATLLWVTCFSGALAWATSLARAWWLAPAMDLAGGILLLMFALMSAGRLASEWII